MKAKRVAASQILPSWQGKPYTGDRQEIIDAVRDALYASKIVSYAQGLDLLGTASKFYDWSLNFGDIATIWRGGCIIRAIFLNRIKEAYEANPSLENLMLAPFFTDVFAKSQAGWRKAICAAVEAGVAAPRSPRALVTTTATAPSAAVEPAPGPARLLRRAHLRARGQARGRVLPHELDRPGRHDDVEQLQRLTRRALIA